jgi:hypothetical protein
MGAPGFTAESSLYLSDAFYRQTGGNHPAGQVVIPQFIHCHIEDRWMCCCDSQTSSCWCNDLSDPPIM